MTRTDGGLHRRDATYYRRARAINAQKDNFAWGIVDGSNPFAEYLEKDAASGAAYKADTLEELAALIDVPAEALTASQEEFHSEYEADPAPLDRALGVCPKYDVSQGPFYAQTVYPRLLFTMAGLEVNENCQVVTTQDQVVPNLYAVGEIAFGNCFFDEYVCGSCAIQIAVNMGRIAGESAAQEIEAR